jgi:hypothetical protein
MIPACFEAERTGLDDPVVRYRQNPRSEMFAATLTDENEIVKGRIGGLEHAMILATVPLFVLHSDNATPPTHFRSKPKASELLLKFRKGRCRL